MTLELCEKDEYTLENGERKPWYKPMEGSILLRAPSLLQEGYALANLALILERRLHSLKNDWRLWSFDGADLCVYHRDGRVKYVSDGLSAIDLLMRLPLVNGAFVGDDVLYDALPGQEFGRESLILGGNLSTTERESHGLWRAVIRRDMTLLSKYGKRFHDSEDAMSVFLSNNPTQTSIRAACVVGLEFWSRFDGGCHLDGDCRRLVGVAPEALTLLIRKHPYLASQGAAVRSALDSYFAQRRENAIQEEAEMQGMQNAGVRESTEATESRANNEQVRAMKQVKVCDFNTQIPLEIPSEEELARMQKEEAEKIQQQQRWNEKMWGVWR